MIKISDTEYFSNDKTIRFLNMDCNVFMAGCKENEFDLNLSDPPYGIGDKFKGGKNSKMKNFNAIVNKKWDEAPSEFCISEIFRTSKNQIIWGGNYFLEHLGSAKCFLIWDKMIGEGMSFADCEMAWTSFKKPTRIKKLLSRSENGKIHPTQKPIDLYDWVITKYAEQNAKILDTHFGSGSIALAVDKANRLDKMNLHLTACEIDKEYIDKAIKRISESIKQGTLSF